MKHYRIQVFGRVQQVGFRYSALTQAEKYQVKGYVKNLADGSVLIEAEGEMPEIENFIQWCRSGPSRSRVDNMEVAETEITGYKNFSIR